MPAVRLEVAEFQDVDHWRFVLKEDGGGFLADHSVALDPADRNYSALIDLPGYLRFYATPSNRDAEERRLLEEVGAWLGAQVLGRSIGDKLRERAHPSVVVRVVVPPEGQRLLTLPLEIVRFDGAPLSLSGVSFVFETTGQRPPPAAPIDDRLRILALFSLPRSATRSISGASGRCYVTWCGA